MSEVETPKIGYVVKRYPRFSETFVVTEILAHERAGWELEIFSLRPPVDTHFQDLIARVRAPVHYLTAAGTRIADFWAAFERAAEVCPQLGSELASTEGEDPVDIFQALLLARELRIRRINHLHAHFATSAANVARLASKFAGISFSFTAHAKDIFHESVNHEDLGRKLAEADAVVTVSDFNREFLREQFGPTADKVQRIYNGLDLRQFPYSDPNRRPSRIIAVGRLIEKKGFADLITACAILKQQDIDFECQMIGGGELEDALREQISRCGLVREVEMLGPRPQCEVIARVGAAALLAVPCVVGQDGNRDGLPTVLLEAMALGTPCVTTGVTGIPELVSHGETGLLVPERDPQALAAEMASLLTLPSLRTELARRARRRIEVDFDIQRNAAQLRTLFSKSTGSPLVLQEVG